MRGQKPRGVFFWSNKKLNVFGALTSENKFYYDFFIAQNSLTYKAFLSDFVETLDQRKKYIFILDNASYHKTNVIKNYLAKFDKFIKVEFIPPYSPELNPIETCWKITRANTTNSKYYKTVDELQDSLENFWNKHFFKLNFINYLCR
ncbi:MAG: IS630 family transposase [Nanoarchaeota archaeon]|nr:IS630 family transposase [Nanoarchaeota archaeon]